jgi:hypothetical protein
MQQHRSKLPPRHGDCAALFSSCDSSAGRLPGGSASLTNWDCLTLAPRMAQQPRASQHPQHAFMIHCPLQSAAGDVVLVREGTLGFAEAQLNGVLTACEVMKHGTTDARKQWAAGSQSRAACKETARCTCSVVCCVRRVRYGGVSSEKRLHACMHICTVLVTGQWVPR